MMATGAVALSVLAVLVAACGTKTSPPPGELMLAVQTDMALPDDMDEVLVLAEANGAILFEGDYFSKSGLLIPATIGFTAKSPGQTVTFKVIGVKATKPRVLREAITTIPTNRLAVLPMPLSWLCDGTAMTVSGTTGDPTQKDFVSTCPAGQSCINGTCGSAAVDSGTLADYTPADLFGGGNGMPDGGGSCFDTLRCFDGATDAQVDMASCTIAAPSSAASFNVALRQPPMSDGICSSDKSLCLVPLDSGPSGWFAVSTSAGPRVQLPPAVCQKLAAKLTLSVVTTPACAAKTSGLPTCGPWSSVTAPETVDASAPSCTDGVKDGSESDVDCGGSCAFKCGDGSACNSAADCTHAYCGAQGKCATPTCTDGVKNGGETDVDCGGGTCPVCAFGKGCGQPADCATATCTASKCSCPAGMAAISPAAPATTYCMDADEVTNAQYQAFLPGPSVATLPATCTWKADFNPAVAIPFGKDNLPVANVDWCDALAYCAAQGKRLCGKIGGGSNAVTDFQDPTKSQWFEACSNGGAKTFPYGTTFGATTCNGAGYGAGAAIAVGQAAQCQGGFAGLLDMSGNVSEWEDSCDGAGGAGMAQSDNCRARGGGFSSQQADLQCNAAITYARSTTDASIGFRCCEF